MDCKLYITTPKQYRFLKALIKKREVMRYEMNELVGALNVPQVKLQLWDIGWPIYCERVTMVDQDGKKTRPGYYFLDDDYMNEARRVVQKWEKVGV